MKTNKRRSINSFVTLAEELTQNQTNNYDPNDLSRRIECIELKSSYENDKISDDLEKTICIELEEINKKSYTKMKLI